MSTESALTAVDLKIAYSGNVAVEIPSIEVRTGELVGVVGANGAGKSTLVNGLAGWSRGEASVSGRVYLRGEDISRLAPFKRVRKGLALIPESKLVFGTLTVDENIRSLEVDDPGPDRHVFSVDELYSLFPSLAARKDHLGSQLSGGERQMLGIARALRLAPSILLLDEPSIGLAPRLVSTVLQTVRQLVDRGLTVMLVEQNVRASIKVVDRLILLERGRILAEGTANEMREDARIAEAYLGAQSH